MVIGRALGVILLVAAGPAAAEDAGAAAFSQCSACHSLAKPAHNGIGPSLVGVVGRKAGTEAGYSYSPAMKAYGQVWGQANLDAYLTAPAKAVPGTKMTFVGVKDAAKRASLIAYLKQQK